MADEIIVETTSTEVVEIGTPGPQGATGQGVPVGGTTGQVLRKASGTNYDTEWATGGAGGGVSSWNDLEDKPATFPPSSHAHTISEVTNLQTSLDGKAATSHSHSISDVTSLQTSLDGKAATSHTHSSAAITDFSAAAAAAAPVQSVAGRTGAVTLAVAEVSGAVSTSDSRLSDARTPSSTLAHASTHHTGGTDAIAPNNISAAWQQTISSLSLGNTTHTATAGRNQLILLTLTNSIGASIVLPDSGNAEGDRFAVRLESSVGQGVTIRTSNYSLVVSSPTVGRTRSLIYTSGAWVEFPLTESHSHTTSDISGTWGPTFAVSRGSSLTNGPFTFDQSWGFAGTTFTALQVNVTDAASAAGSLLQDWQVGGSSVASVGKTGAGTFTALIASSELQVPTNAPASPSAGDLYRVSDTLRYRDSANTERTIALTSDITGGGTKTYATFTTADNQPPATAFATLDTRNSIAVLDFDAATDESAVFVGIMPEAASLGSGLIVRLHWMATTATSGNVRWGVQFERSNTDLDSDSFAAVVEANGAANGTSGILTTTAITVTDFDGITAGDVFRLKVFRNADDATNDTMTGDAELVAVEVRSAA